MAVAPAPSRLIVVKKEPKTVVTSVKDAKSDSSFFSAPKPKPKLPTFKKALNPVVKTETVTNIAQPSSIDPFQEVLKSMKARKESPAQSTPPPKGASKSPPAMVGLTKSGKKKKSVSWASEEQLESIRFIEKAVYDDDPIDVSTLFIVNLLLF
jgi:protein phosphatase 1 regulatory subunit 10